MCSRCKVNTALPHTDPSKSINLGEAAHIKGRRQGLNNRYDSEMSDKDRADISNGIWLCSTCHNEIDSDEIRYTSEAVLKIKSEHEEALMDKGSRRVLSQQAYEKLDPARKAFNNGKFEEAIELFSKNLREDSSDDTSIFLRASCYFEMNDYYKALGDYENYSKINPKDAASRFNAGLCCWKLAPICEKESEKAYMNYMRSFDDKFTKLRNDYNDYRDQYLKTAKFWFEEAIIFDHSFSEAYNMLGEWAILQKERMSAVAYWHLALEFGYRKARLKLDEHDNYFFRRFLLKGEIESLKRTLHQQP